MLTAINAISLRKVAARVDTAQKITRFLNYAATQPKAAIRYHASNMVLNIHVDLSYFSEPKRKAEYQRTTFSVNWQSTLKNHNNNHQKSMV